MTLDGVMADTEEDGFRFNFAPLITNGACLGRSAWGGVLWVEIKHYFVADKI
jgi:hypothetical protein